MPAAYITGINCPKCGKQSHTTVDTRANPTGRRRRKECHTCGFRFNTFEVTEELARVTGILPIIKRLLAVSRSASYRATLSKTQR